MDMEGVCALLYTILCYYTILYYTILCLNGLYLGQKAVFAHTQPPDGE
jgi:hypothetical protein